MNIYQLSIVFIFTQESSGSFPEFGNVYHKEMQGGSNNGIGLTAFTLLAFLENKVCIVV